MTQEELNNVMESLGAKRVALSSNPSEKILVTDTRLTYANEINRLEALRKDINGNDSSKERQRTISRAQTHAEDACMLAIKALLQ